MRANTTTATAVVAGDEGPGRPYRLNGHKWFTSAPMSDAFLTLAQTPEGISCFIVPRWIPESGERNRGLQFVRLKDKLGDRSNASSEVECAPRDRHCAPGTDGAPAGTTTRGPRCWGRPGAGWPPS